MIGHLGTRISALLDGQLPPAEADEAWAHVYACHQCRDRVEREGWVKAQLAGLAGDARAVPDHLVGSLRSFTPGERYADDPTASARDLAPGARPGRRTVAMVGGGAVGAAMLGILALGIPPASSPSDRRPPPANVGVSHVPAPTDPASEAVRIGNRPVRAELTDGATVRPTSIPTPTADLLQAPANGPR